MKKQSSKSAKVLARCVLSRPASITAILLTCLLAFNLSAQASLLTLTFTNQVGQPDTNIVRTIALDNKTPVLANGTVLTKGLPVKWTPDSNGVVNFYLTTGNYLLTNAYLGSGIVYCFPDSTTNATAYPKSGFNTFITSVQIIQTNVSGAITNGSSGATLDALNVSSALLLTNASLYLTGTSAITFGGGSSIGADGTISLGGLDWSPVSGKLSLGSGSIEASNVPYAGSASNLIGTLPVSQLPPQASTNGSILARDYYGKPGIFTVIDAAAYTSAFTNEQSVSLLTDIIGTNSFPAISVKFRNAGMNGFPALIFNQSTSIASNANYFTRNPGMNTNITMFFVFSHLTTASNFLDGMLLTCGNPTRLTSFTINGMEGGQADIQLAAKTNSVTTATDVRGNYETEIYAVRYDGTYIDTWLNGCVSVLGRVGANGFSATGQFGGLGLNENCYIGNYADSQKTPCYAISKILIYTNALSYADVQSVNLKLCAEYGKKSDIILVGDSITRGDKTTKGNTLMTLVGNALSQLQIVQSAGSANNSYRMLTNMTGVGGWLGSVPVNDGAVFMPESWANDQANGYTVANLCTNLLIMCNAARSNNIAMGVVTAMSWGAGETSGFKTNFNNWVYANSNLFDFVVDLAAVPALGTNGACNNTNIFFTDATHPLNAGYQLMAQVYAAAIQKYRASKSIGTNLSGAFTGSFTGDGSGLTGSPLETMIFQDIVYDQSGSLTRSISPFMGADLNPLYAGTNPQAPCPLWRLAPAALATGKTNLVAEFWLTSTNTVSSFNINVSLAVQTNDPSGGVGGTYFVINNANYAKPAGTILASNWFRMSTTSAIPNVIWTNLNGGWSRYSFYNNTTTNCWMGGLKFYLQ